MIMMIIFQIPFLHYSAFISILELYRSSDQKNDHGKILVALSVFVLDGKKEIILPDQIMRQFTDIFSDIFEKENMQVF